MADIPTGRFSHTLEQIDEAVNDVGGLKSSNTKLTDAVKLIIDYSGIKNRYPYGNAITTGSGYAVREQPISLPAGVYHFRCNKNYTGKISFNFKDSTGTTIVNPAPFQGVTGVCDFAFTLDRECKKITIYNNSASGDPESLELTDIMICFNSFWNISSNYVPYSDDVGMAQYLQLLAEV